MAFKLLTLAFEKDSGALKDATSDISGFDFYQIQKLYGKKMNGEEIDELVRSLVEPGYSVSQLSIRYHEDQISRTYTLLENS